MNKIKTVFSIKDLENLTGIKAHTIRIWEKRYNILEPMRTDTNIRLYDGMSLQKILNVKLLHDYGYKISKISKLPEEKIPDLVNEIISEKSSKHHAISSFKMAMMNFDQISFLNTYDQLLSEKNFQETFTEILVPFIIETGFLWQTGTISAAHEHFVSNLIKQKLLINNEKLQYKAPSKKDRVFVLYLPDNEIHQLGLMYMNYEAQLHGYRTVYLGENVPLEDLKDMKKYFTNIVFICYMTVSPNPAQVNNYIKKLQKELLTDESELWMIGRMVANIDPKNISNQMKVFTSINDFTTRL